MYCFKTLSWFLLPLLLLECSQSSAQHTSSAVTAVASSSSLSPSCLQSRAPTASSAAAIQSSIVSDDSISKACDTSTQQWITTSGTQKTYYALDSTYFFNISLASGVTGGPTDQECTNFFNTILSSCVMSQNFWGGWIVSSATNYSISHTPPRPVSSAASSIYTSARSSGTASESLGPSSGKIPPSSVTARIVSSTATASPRSSGDFASSASSASNSSFASSASSASIPSSAPASTSIYVFDGVTFTSGPSGLVAGTATVHPGGTAVTISSHTFSLGPSGSSIAVDGTVSPLSQGITKIPNGSSSTSAIISVSSFASSAAAGPAPSLYTFDGVVFTSAASGLIAGTATVKPGGPAITISSHTFSLGSLGSTIAVDGTLSALKPPQDSTTNSVSISTPSAKTNIYTFDGIVFTSGTGGLVAGTATVKPGGPAITISSHTFSLGPAGSTVAVDGTLSPLTPPQVLTSNSVSKSSASLESSVTLPPSRVYTIDGIALTGNPSSALTIAGSTITPGGPPAIVSSHTFSIPAAASGSEIKVDGTLTHLSIPTATGSASPGSTKSAISAPMTTNPFSTYTIDGVAFTGNPTSLATANWTLTAGGSAMTISSHTFHIPISAKGGAINVDGTLTTLPSPGATGTRSLGSSTRGSRSPAESSANSATSRGSSAESQAAISGYTFMVTATDTAIPAGFSALVSSNADWHSNTWITTTDKSGHTTILPVLVGCKVCGGIGGGIILWGVPPIPKISFSFPKFNLPSFSLPCIPIPLIKSCNSPGDSPTTDVDNSTPGSDPNKPNPNDPDGNPDDPEPDEEQKTQEQKSEEQKTEDQKTKTKPGQSSTPITTAPKHSSSTPSSSVTSGDSCDLTVASLTPFTDLATLDTGGITSFGSMTSSAATSTNASSCALTIVSLTPFTDLATLDTGGITSFGSMTSSAATTSNASSCALTVVSLTPFTDLATLDTGGITSLGTATRTATMTETTTNASSCALTVVSLTPFTDLATLDTSEAAITTATPTDTFHSSTGHPSSTIKPTVGSSHTSINDISTSTPATHAISVTPQPQPTSTTSTFNMASTTLDCGAKYSTDSGAIYTSIPRAQTGQILSNIGDFCTPSDNGVGDTLTLKKGEPAYHTMRFDAPGLMLYQFMMLWDPRPECANIPAPEVRDAVPKGPDYWCQVYFDAITNTCDAAPGENKNGGIMYAECVIWAWEAFDGCSGDFAKENNC